MRSWGIFLLVGLLVFGVGCAKVDDEAEIEALIDTLEELVLDYGGQETGDVKDAITPVAWWRELLQHHRTVDIEMFQGESAYVTITHDITAQLHIVTVDSVNVDKDINDVGVRYAVFKKDTVEGYHGGWRLVGLSPVEIECDNGSTVDIDSVVIEVAGERVYALSDPTVIIGKEGILELPPSTDVAVRVYTTPDTVLAFLHTFRRRWRFQMSEPGVYEGVWTTPDSARIYRVGVDLMTRETLWDDVEPYDSKAWIMPYRVVVE